MEQNRNHFPRVLIVTPEVTYLPDQMGSISWCLSAKAGGLADVFASLVCGLYRQGANVHMAIPIYRAISRAVAGNLALTGMATGGVFLGGGIPPKILPLLEKPDFMDSFTAKGRFSDFLATIPVRVICNDKAALIGAAQCAFELLTSKGENHDK
jgi:hypothetical protein